MSRCELCRQIAVQLGFHFVGRQSQGRDMQLRSNSRYGSDSMVRRKSDPDVGKSKLAAQEVKESSKLVVQSQRHGLHLRSVRPDFVAEDVIRGQADNQQVSCRSASQLLVCDQIAGKIKLVVVGKWRGSDYSIKILFPGLNIRRPQHLAAGVFPFQIEILFRMFTVVEFLYPLGKLAAVVSRSDP